MANLNRVFLMGNLTRDPQLTYTPNNTAVCKFGMAINRQWTDRNSGERRQEVCYVDLTAFARSAETINQYCNKGSALFVEGRLQFSQWQTPEGQNRSKLDVVVDQFQFIGGPKQNGGQQGGYNQGGQNANYASQGGGGYGQPSPAPDSAPPMDVYPNGGMEPGGDDVPF